jgi:hypothetical protein
MKYIKEDVYTKMSIHIDNPIKYDPGEGKFIQKYRIFIDVPITSQAI